MQISIARRTSVSEAPRRYSPVARISSIGDSGERCSGLMVSAISALALNPIKSLSNRIKRRAVAEQDPTETWASATQPLASFWRTAATIEIEITRYRRAPNFKNAEAALSTRRGTRMPVRISSATRNVFRFPVRNRPRGICLFPAVETNSTSASSANSGGTPSAAGDALHRFPATVPRFWICTDPTSRAASFNASKDGGNGL